MIQIVWPDAGLDFGLWHFGAGSNLGRISDAESEIAIKHVEFWHPDAKTSGKHGETNSKHADVFGFVLHVFFMHSPDCIHTSLFRVTLL